MKTSAPALTTFAVWAVCSIVGNAQVKAFRYKDKVKAERYARKLGSEYYVASIRVKVTDDGDVADFGAFQQLPERERERLLLRQRRR